MPILPSAIYLLYKIYETCLVPKVVLNDMCALKIFFLESFIPSYDIPHGVSHKLSYAIGQGPCATQRAGRQQFPALGQTS